MKPPQFIKDNLFMTISLAAAVAATLFFTFEPLVSATLTTQARPGRTILAISSLNKTAQQNILVDTVNILKSRSLILPYQTIFSEIPIRASSVALAPKDKTDYTFTFVANVSPETALKSIRMALAKQNPSEIITILPDGTAMTEVVIDPSLIQVKDLAFTQTYPPIIIGKNGLNSSISIGNSPPVHNHSFGKIESCQKTVNNNLILSTGSARFTLAAALFKNLLAYFRYFSCFQLFSTIK